MTREIAIDGRHVPKPVKQREYWVLWDYELKQPRAPWETGHCFPCEWRQDGDVNPRTTYEQADAAADLGPEKLDQHYSFPNDPPDNVGPTLLLPHAGTDTPGPEPADPPVLFIDYDDVLNKTDNTVPSEVWDTASSIGGPLFVSRSFLDDSAEAAGLHQLARGTLPGAVTTVTAPFDDAGHIEIYKKSRMTGFTWRHVRGTPKDELPNASDAVASIIDEYGKDSTKRRANSDPTEFDRRQSAGPVRSEKEIEELDSTDDIQDVYDAIAHIGPDDIQLRSAETTDGGGRRRSFDPSWEQSESGERLGYDSLRGGEGWIYRDGSDRVDALQVVAAEERIITDITDYPEGEKFWKAVQELRERNANIPYYEGENGTHPDILRLYEAKTDVEDQRRQALRAALASERA